MIRVMIVDDEPAVFRYFKKMIEEADSDFKVVNEALNGVEALERISLVQPDVIITDIRMPVMDGLSLVEELKKAYPGIITVIMSAHQDFSYMRKAILLNAEDYLLKPFDMGSLKDMLQRVKVKLKSMHFIKEYDILKSVVTGKRKSFTVQNIQNSRYTVFLICAGSYCKYVLNELNAGRVLWEKYDLNGLVERITDRNNEYWVFDGKRENEKVIIQANINEKMPDLNILMDSIKELDFGEIPITVVLSQHTCNINDLSRIIDDLRKRLLRILVFSKNTIYSENENKYLLGYGQQHINNKKNYENISISIKNLNNKAFTADLHEYLSLCCKNNFTQLSLENSLKNILSLFDKSRFNIQDDEAIDLNIEIDELLSNSVNYDELFQGASYIFANLFERISSQLEKDSYQEGLIKRVEEYLLNNYAKMLTLQDIAQEFNLVPSYFCTFFKKAKGVTLGDYITELRIEKAISLIQSNPGIMMKNVAEIVGYRDPLYFSRVFKKITGKTPSEYV